MQPSPPAPTPPHAPPIPRQMPWTHIGLLGILLLAAALRLAGLSHVAPPGLNQDEAVNGWNAWCLLKTGQDQAGVRWPIFYTQALGENRTTLFLYTLLPFQLIGGLSVLTTRLPSAVGGVLTVLLLYWIAARLFNRPTGLVAALLLALNPWHIQLSRLGHEAAICPLLTCAALAIVLWAGFPLDNATPRPRIWRGLLAGLVVGICCYGYPAIRLFLPVFLTACVLVTCRGWWRFIRARSGMAAVGALLLGVGATFGPLAYYHVAHAEEIAKRAERLWLWDATDSPSDKVSKVLERYLAHFGPDFLFVNGDHFEMQAPHGFGEYSWYILPLALIGLVPALGGLIRSRGARVLLCWVILFPAGDCLHRHVFPQQPDGKSLHALRSAPGLCAPLLLAAVGAAGAGRLLWRKQRVAAMVAGGALVLAGGALDTRFLMYFFGEHNRRPEIRYRYQADLVEACDWLRPRLAEADAVFVTVKGMNMPYVVMMVALGYDPQQWFRDERDLRALGQWNHYFRVGKLYFSLQDQSTRNALDALAQNNRLDRVIFIVRPGELRLTKPADTITGPDGNPTLEIFAEQL